MQPNRFFLEEKKLSGKKRKEFACTQVNQIGNGRNKNKDEYSI